MMRMKRILWVLAAFICAGVICASEARALTALAQESATSAALKTQMAAKSAMGDQGQEETGQKSKSQAQASGPLTEKEVTKEIKSAPAETVIIEVKQRGVDFDMTPEIEKKLRKAKATDAVIEAVRQAGRTARAERAKAAVGAGPAGVQNVPKEQSQAYEAIRGELDPDKTIALVDDFTKKYPNSPYLPYVYFFGANGYQQKGDAEKVVEYTGKGLKLSADNLPCLIMRIGMLPQPQYLNNHAADRDKILQEAESDANRALQLIAKFPKQPSQADADYQKFQAYNAAQIRGSLGMVHLELALESLAGPDKAELAKAEQEFKTAVTMTDRPDPQDYFRMGEAYAMDGKLDDAIQAFGKASELGQGTMIKTYADQRIEEMKKRKAQAAAAPSPK